MNEWAYAWWTWAIDSNRSPIKTGTNDHVGADKVRLVLVNLARYAWSEDGEVWPSGRTQLNDLGWRHNQTLQHCHKVLVAHGLIERVPNPDGKSIRYKLKGELDVGEIQERAGYTAQEYEQVSERKSGRGKGSKARGKVRGESRPEKKGIGIETASHCVHGVRKGADGSQTCGICAEEHS